jgi:hypothetical protein
MLSLKCYSIAWSSLPVVYGMKHKLKMHMFVLLLAQNFGLTFVYLFTPIVGSLMNTNGSDCSLLLLFAMKVMVWHFVCSFHMIMIAPVVNWPSKYYYEDLRAML